MAPRPCHRCGRPNSLMGAWCVPCYVHVMDDLEALNTLPFGAKADPSPRHSVGQSPVSPWIARAFPVCPVYWEGGVYRAT